MAEISDRSKQGVPVYKHVNSHALRVKLTHIFAVALRMSVVIRIQIYYLAHY